MSQVFYFVADAPQSVTLEDVKGWGLGYAFDQAPEVRRSALAGVPGVLLSRGGGNETAKVDEAAQAWHRMPAIEGAPHRWFGWDKLDPPTPETLARNAQLDGYWVTDAAGRRWRLPKVRRPNDHGQPESCLPSVYDYDENGRLRAGEPIGSHAKLWEATGWVWEAMIHENDVPEQDCLLTIGVVMAANYRVDWPELIKLGAFCTSPELTPSAWLALASGAVDFYRWREAKRADPTQSQAETLGETS